MHNVVAKQALNKDTHQSYQAILVAPVLDILTTSDARSDEKIHVFRVQYGFAAVSIDVVSCKAIDDLHGM